MVNTINNYIKVKDELDVSTGEQLSDDELESLTSMQMKIQNWKSRITEMHPDIQKKFKALVKDYNTYRLNTRTSLEEERNLRSFDESLFALSELDAEIRLSFENANRFIFDLLRNNPFHFQMKSAYPFGMTG